MEVRKRQEPSLPCRQNWCSRSWRWVKTTFAVVDDIGRWITYVSFYVDTTWSTDVRYWISWERNKPDFKSNHLNFLIHNTRFSIEFRVLTIIYKRIFNRDKYKKFKETYFLLEHSSRSKILKWTEYQSCVRGKIISKLWKIVKVNIYKWHIHFCTSDHKTFSVFHAMLKMHDKFGAQFFSCLIVNTYDELFLWRVSFH